MEDGSKKQKRLGRDFSRMGIRESDMAIRYPHYGRLKIRMTILVIVI